MKRKYTSVQRTKFEEERTRLLLAYVWPEKYESAVLGESPDIWNEDKDIGVEVTSGLRKDIQQSLSRAISITGKTDEELTDHDRKNISEQRVISLHLPNGRNLAGTYAFWGDNYNIKGCIEKKYARLNSENFRKFKENNLFIHAWMMDQEELDEAIECICSDSWIDRSKDSCFDRIFVFTGHVLVEVTVRSHNVVCLKIPDQVIEEASQAAYRMIMLM